MPVITDIRPTSDFRKRYCECGCKEPIQADIRKEIDGIIMSFSSRTCLGRYLADHTWR